MEIDRVVEFGEVLECSASAAPKGLIFCARGLPRPGRHREEIDGQAGLRLYGAEAMVEEITLVVVDVLHVAGTPVEMTCQLHHVVRATALLVVRTDLHLQRETVGVSKPTLGVS